MTTLQANFCLHQQNALLFSFTHFKTTEISELLNCLCSCLVFKVTQQAKSKVGHYHCSCSQATLSLCCNISTSTEAPPQGKQPALNSLTKQTAGCCQEETEKVKFHRRLQNLCPRLMLHLPTATLGGSARPRAGHSLLPEVNPRVPPLEQPQGLSLHWIFQSCQVKANTMSPESIYEMYIQALRTAAGAGLQRSLGSCLPSTLSKMKRFMQKVGTRAQCKISSTAHNYFAQLKPCKKAAIHSNKNAIILLSSSRR